MTVQEKQRELQRIHSLHERNLVSEQQTDQAKTDLDAAQARLAAVQESSNAARVSLGDAGEQNLRVRMAVNQVKQAQLNLSRTDVRAPEDGVVTNLQLVAGVQASAGQPLMSLVGLGNERIAADFREKSLARVDDQVSGWVVFDACPARYFRRDCRAVIWGWPKVSCRPMARWHNRTTATAGCVMPSGYGCISV